VIREYRRTSLAFNPIQNAKNVPVFVLQEATHHVIDSGFHVIWIGDSGPRIRIRIERGKNHSIAGGHTLSCIEESC